LPHFRLLIATLVALALPMSAAHSQRVSSTPSESEESYVIDSRGLTVYRQGQPVCQVNCAIGGPVGGFSDSAPLQQAFPGAEYRKAPLSEPIPANTPPMALSLPTPPAQSVAEVSEARVPEKPSSGFTKEQKAVILNAGVLVGVAAYGVGFWDYFQTAPKASSEGWFGRTTDDGGMDKLGHFWMSYSVSHLYSYLYRWWDFSPGEANALGALSSLGIQTAMELGDAFSGGYGFSYEDAIMNAVGAGAAYVLGRYPSIARKIDFRMEYKPSSFSDLTDDILTDYENQRYLIALKLDGFDMFHDSYLSYLELHAGYQARGYEDFTSGGDDDRRRSLYFGVGFNVSKLVRQYSDIGIFDYLQVPYTSVGVTSGLD
jgi:hypothetical protein